jgi:YVTN family beta-propeller protein
MRKKIFLRFIVCVFLFLPLLHGCSKRSGAPIVFITNERDGTISVIDSGTDEVIESIFVGARPRGIRVSPDGKRIYVALSTPMNRKYNHEENKILAVDTESGKVLSSFDVGTDPEQLAVSADGKLLYASNEDAGTASVTDVETNRVLATLIVGIEPEGVTISPDGRWVYVMAETSSTVSVIDTEKRAVVQTFMVGNRQRDAAFSPDGTRAYVPAELGKTLSVVDVAKHEVIATVPLLQDETAKPVGVVVSPDGKKDYVANGRHNSISVLDAESFRHLKIIPVGNRVWGLGMTPDGKKSTPPTDFQMMSR